MADSPSEQAKQLFRLIAQAPAEQRPALLNGLQPDLRREVELLLKVHVDGGHSDAPSDIRDSIASETIDRPSPQQLPNPAEVSRIGPYHILREIGEGGMGVVYEAEQEEPVRRKVALKLIKWGMDTKAVVARFESERQALALMNHHNIASVYDAGATPEGRPYFAMEYVQGIPITEYCDKHRMTIKARLKLFIQVCEGVQHAHQKGIIHRDIKPSNVLVAVQNDKPVPKIIDFGVAKATSQRLTEHTVATELGQLIGTPEYMSPEQAEMTNLDIDTRTDVYSLGAVLYELLVGAQPFDPKELRAAGLVEIQRKLREDEPPRPSTRVSRLGTSSATSASNRRVDVRALGRQLRGDLDWIAMKALEKDRTRRYETPNGLALDVTRFLASEPVRARPASALYKTRRFVRRHWAGVAASSTVILLLVVVVVVTLVQSARIARERDRAEQETATTKEVTEFLIGLFEESDPGQSRGEDISASKLLERGTERILRLSDQPLVQSQLMSALGRIHEDVGLYAESESLLRRSLAIQREGLGENHEQTLDTARLLARALERQGKYDEAGSLLEDTIERLQEVSGAFHPSTLAAKSGLATNHARVGRRSESERLFLEVLEHVQHDEDLRLAAMNNLGVLYRAQERYREAVALDEEILEIRERALGEDHPLVIATLNNLALGYHELGRTDDANAYIQRAISLAYRVLGPEHPNYGAFVHTSGELLLSEGRWADAEERLKQALSVYELQKSHEFLGLVLYQLAEVSVQRSKYDEALAYLRRSLESGYAHNDDPLGFARSDSFSAIRYDPRFEKLIREAGAKTQ